MVYKSLSALSFCTAREFYRFLDIFDNLQITDVFEFHNSITFFFKYVVYIVLIRDIPTNTQVLVSKIAKTYSFI